MSSPTAATRAAAAEPRRPGRIRLYALEARYELLKLLRLPAYALPTIAFPVLFYLFFGVAFAGRMAGPVSMAAYLVATYGVFGVIGASLFGFGVAVAIERGQGWLILKRASPMPAGAFFAAKMVMALVFGAIIVAALFAVAATLGGVSMPAERWVLLGAVQVLGAVPFCAFGLALGYAVGPNAAPAVANLIYLPMSFLSGLWVPLPALPDLVQAIAPTLPAYHFAQLALTVIGADAPVATAWHLAYLTAFTAASLLLARWAYVRNADVTYG